MAEPTSTTPSSTAALNNLAENDQQHLLGLAGHYGNMAKTLPEQVYQVAIAEGCGVPEATRLKEMTLDRLERVQKSCTFTSNALDGVMGIVDTIRTSVADARRIREDASGGLTVN